MTEMNMLTYSPIQLCLQIISLKHLLYKQNINAHMFSLQMLVHTKN